MAESVKEPPKRFWLHVQYKIRTKSGICNLIYFDNNIKLSAMTDKKNAEVLAPFFHPSSQLR